MKEFAQGSAAIPYYFCLMPHMTFIKYTGVPDQKVQKKMTMKMLFCKLSNTIMVSKNKYKFIFWSVFDVDAKNLKLENVINK